MATKNTLAALVALSLAAPLALARPRASAAAALRLVGAGILLVAPRRWS